MKKIFINGGVRSGKSSSAIEKAKELGGDVIFVAAAQETDEEMSARIKRHKQERPRNWRTIEEPLQIADIISELSGKTVIVDCIGTWITNLLMNDLDDEAVMLYIEEFVRTFKDADNNIIIVSNEVGMGIVPEHRLARRFRDLTGTANQKLAKAADEFLFMQSGYQIKFK